MVVIYYSDQLVAHERLLALGTQASHHITHRLDPARRYIPVAERQDLEQCKRFLVWIGRCGHDWDIIRWRERVEKRVRLLILYDGGPHLSICAQASQGELACDT